jgi:two-component sensor histidine kinase
MKRIYLVGAFLCIFASCLYGVSLKRVLVLHSYHAGFVWTDSIDSGIRSVFKGIPDRVEIIAEYMDTKRHVPNSLYPRIKELLEHKYGAWPVDLIITTDDSAFQFIKFTRDQIFPGVPVVFCGLNDYYPFMIRGLPGFTGVAEIFDIGKNLELIMRLHPEVENVAVITDATEISSMNLNRYYAAAEAFKTRLNFIMLTNFSKRELQEALRRLPAKSAVLNLGFWRDRDEVSLSHRESLNLISENSDVPVYTAWDYMVGYGTIGGFVTDGHLQGSRAADIALAVLNGRDPGTIPVETNDVNSYFFDYPALKKFNVPLSRLPEKSIFLNKPESSFYRYFIFFWVALAVIGALLALALFLSRTVRNLKDAESVITASLQEKEILLKEIHHRVKNNLQIISSLLNLQADTISDPEDRRLFDESRSRVIAMALVHENLYRSDNLGAVKIDEYLKTLAGNLEAGYGKDETSLNFDLEPVTLDIDHAVPCGLIATELLSNCFKHAFPEGRRGTIRVRLRQDSDARVALTVSDDGIGVPEGFDLFAADSLGFSLVRVLTDQLKGTLEFKNHTGTEVLIRFPGGTTVRHADS